MNLKRKIFLKGMFHTFLQLSFVMLFGFFNKCLLEMAIIYVCFFIFRSKFEKQYHARTTWLCTLYTIIIFYLVSNISPNKSLSIVLIVLFTYLINDISFYVRDYLDLKDRFKSSQKDIKKGIDKYELLKICQDNNLTKLETDILIYYYCDRLSLTAISYKVNYSYDYVAELKSKIIKKIKRT